MARYDVGDFADRNGVDLIEYPDRTERALLICAGTGLMLSLMDQCPRLRWCFDADTLSADQQAALATWLPLAAPRIHLLAFAGWYCSTNPAPVADALRRVTQKRVLVYAQCHGVGADPFDDLWSAFSVDQLIEQINSFPQQDPVERAIAESDFNVRRMTWDEFVGQ